MDYGQIVNLIFSILTTIIGAFTIYYFVFSIIGLFARKKFKETDVKLKYGIIVSARNEEKVVGNLIDSIRQNDYPQDKLEVFVIAHNCSDNTAKVAKEHGAVVYEYNNKNEATKGFAIKRLIENIKNDYNIDEFDGFFVFDADNILTTNYISKMNDAFVYYNKKRIITSFRNSKNFGSSLTSALYGTLFIQNCRFECRGRTICNCSTRVQGTGFLLNTEVVKNGWEYVTLTEDWELTADQILQGNKVMYCDEAMFYDEQPTNFKFMTKQRLRWAKGHLLVFKKKSKELFKHIFKRSTKNKFSTYDILINIIPIGLIGLSLSILQIILLAFAPIFLSDYLIVWKDTAINSLKSIAVAYLVQMIIATIMFACEHKRICGVSFFKKISTILMWPLFNIYSTLLGIIALFKKIEWETIPHTDTTNIEKINNNKIKYFKKKAIISNDESVKSASENI